MNSNRVDAGIASLLAALSFGTYCFIGYALSTTGVFAEYDHIFNADPNRVIEDLAGGGCVFEVTTIRHPLLVLFFSPLGTLLNFATGSKAISAVVLNSLFGGLFVGLFYLLLRGIDLKRFLASSFTLILAFSTSSLVFGSVPDTFIFSAFGLLLMFTIDALIENDRRFLTVFIPASIFAAGITSLNVVACFIIIVLRYRRCLDYRHGLLRGFLISGVFIGMLAVAVFAALLLLQKLVYPSTFAITGSAKVEKLVSTYIHGPFRNGSLRILEENAPFYYKHNIISPGLNVRRADAALPYIWPFEKEPHRFESEGRIGEYNIRFLSRTFYCIVVLTAFGLLVKASAYRDRIFIALCTYYIFTVVFHYIYAPWQVYVFSTHYTFPWVAMLALSMKPAAGLGKYSRRFIHATLFCFLVLMSLNNYFFAYELIDVFL